MTLFPSLAFISHGLLIIHIHCFGSINLFFIFYFFVLWLPLHLPGGCCTLVVVEEKPLYMFVKRFGCTAVHSKALYKCLIRSFFQFLPFCCLPPWWLCHCDCFSHYCQLHFSARPWQSRYDLCHRRCVALCSHCKTVRSHHTHSVSAQKKTLWILITAHNSNLSNKDFRLIVIHVHPCAYNSKVQEKNERNRRCDRNDDSSVLTSEVWKKHNRKNKYLCTHTSIRKMTMSVKLFSTAWTSGLRPLLLSCDKRVKRNTTNK